MNQLGNQSQPGLSVDVRDELSRNITIHKNVDQEIIITTADKIQLVLINTKEVLTSQRDWWTPFGLFVSFITTLCTADFKEAMDIKKEVWEALFILLTIVSFIWLVRSLIRFGKNWGKDDMKEIISQIKLESSVTQKKP